MGKRNRAYRAFYVNQYCRSGFLRHLKGFKVQLVHRLTNWGLRLGQHNCQSRMIGTVTLMKQKIVKCRKTCSMLLVCAFATNWSKQRPKHDFLVFRRKQTTKSNWFKHPHKCLRKTCQYFAAAENLVTSPTVKSRDSHLRSQRQEFAGQS